MKGFEPPTLALQMPCTSHCATWANKPVAISPQDRYWPYISQLQVGAFQFKLPVDSGDAWNRTRNLQINRLMITLYTFDSKEQVAEEEIFSLPIELHPHNINIT